MCVLEFGKSFMNKITGSSFWRVEEYLHLVSFVDHLKVDGIEFLLSKVPFVVSMTVCICHPSPAGQITVWEELNENGLAH